MERFQIFYSVNKMTSYSGIGYPNSCKTRCNDILHGKIGKTFYKFNLAGDYLITVEMVVVLLILFSGNMDINITMQCVLIILFLFCVRGIIAAATTCSIDSNISSKPLFTDNGDNVWYFISGHTASASIMAIIILHSSVPYSLKIASIILASLVCFFQAATQEHHTVDIVFTLILVYLCYSVFLRTHVKN